MPHWSVLASLSKYIESRASSDALQTHLSYILPNFFSEKKGKVGTSATKRFLVFFFVLALVAEPIGRKEMTSFFFLRYSFLGWVNLFCVAQAIPLDGYYIFRSKLDVVFFSAHPSGH